MLAADFTPGNPVVYRVGDGLSALGPNATAVFLVEYSAATGAVVQTIPMPTVASGGNRRLTASGAAPTEGLISRSDDRRYLVVTGYDAAVGTAGLPATSAATVNRVVGRIDLTATVDTTTALNDFASSGFPRSVASSDGSAFWVSGSTGGSRYALQGASSSTQLNITATDLRQSAIFGGQLFVSSNAGTLRVATVGTGLPTTGGQSISNLSGFPTSGSPYSFVLLDLSGAVAGVDTLYVADDAPGTLLKYSLVGGTWTSNGSVSVPGVRGVTGRITTGTTVELFATSPNQIVRLTDTAGYNAAIVGAPAPFAPAPANTAFRGIAFAPEPSGPEITAEPTDASVCEGLPATFSLAATNATSYQWQVDTGSGFVDVPSVSPYSGETTSTLSIDPTSASMDGFQYQCVVSGSSPPSVTSTSVDLLIFSTPAITTNPTNQVDCAGGGVSFSVAASGSGLSYQWQESTGGTFGDLVDGGTYSGVTTATLSIGSSAGKNGYLYRCVVSGTCTPPSTSGSALLTTLPASPAPPDLTPGCTNVALSWGAVLNATDYEVWRESGNGCTLATQVAATTAGATSYDDTGLGVATTWTYFVVAKNSCGAGSPGTCATASTLPDADGDGTADGCDSCTDTDDDGFGDPGYPSNTCTTDNCPSVPNPLQEDTDGDGVGNLCDNCPYAANADQADTNGNGIGDACEGNTCPLTALPNDNSTSSNERAPTIRARYGRSVYLITPSELSSVGFVAGTTFTGIGWSYQTAPGLAGTGNLVVYLENTSDTTNTKSTSWSTATSGMTVVHDASTTLPNVTGSFDITFSGGNPFTYTGGGLYVAFDMQYPIGTLGTTVVVWCNSKSLTGGLLGAQSNSSPPSTLAASNFRPETRFTPTTWYQNQATMKTIATYGSLPLGFFGPQSIEASIANPGSAALTSLPVTLTVSGTNPGTDTVVVPTISSCGGAETVTFAPYLPTALGSSTVTVNLPADDITADDSISIQQDVTTSLYSLKYPGTTPSGGAGFGSTTGAVAVAFPVAVPTSIETVELEFNSAPATTYRVGIWSDDGSGMPGTQIYLDAADRTVTAAGPVTITLPSPVCFCAGNLFAVIEQTNTTNMSLAYDAEVPVRIGKFFLSTALPPATWSDFSPSTDIRPNVGVGVAACAIPLSVDVTPDGTSDACMTGNLVFTATPTGTGPFTYQWTEDGVDIPGATAATYTVSMPSPMTHTYNCKVGDAVNCRDVVDPSSSTGTWVAAGVGTPGAPVTTPACSSVELAWTAVPGATDYEVWRSDDTGCAGAIQIAASTGGATSYVDNGLVAGEVHGYSIVGRNPCGTGPAGACSSAAAADAPSVTVTPSASAICAGGSVDLAAVSGPGYALDFAGDGSRVVLANPGTIDTGTDFTWEAWVRTTEDGTIVARSPASGNWAQGGKSLFIRSGKLTLDVGWVGYLESPGAIDDGSWHHVAVTTEFEVSGVNDETILYIDGSAVASRNGWNVNSFPESGLALRIGFTSPNFPTTTSLTGTLDEVRIWSRVLSPAEILAGMNSPATPEADLAAEFRFDEGSGLVAGDASGTGHDGTLEGPPSWVVSTAPVGSTADTWSWSPATGLSATSGATVTASPTSTTTYTVTATRTATGCQAMTNVTVTVLPPTPAAPAEPTITAGCSSIDLDWSAVADATDYEVWRSAGAGCGAATQVAATTAGATSWSDGSVALGESFSYSILAKNSCGTSPAGTCSAPASIAYPATMNANDLVVSKSGSDNHLEWGTVAGATGYDVYSTADPAANEWPDPNPSNTVPSGWTQLNGAAITTTTWDHPGAAADAVDYHYHVSPSNSCGSNQSQPR